MPIVHQVGQGEVVAKLARFRLVEPWLLKDKSLKFSGRISTYNARSERFTENKPRAMWPNYFKQKRCLILVTGFYEYQYRDRDGPGQRQAGQLPPLPGRLAGRPGGLESRAPAGL